MRTSDSINELATALSAAQGEMKAPAAVESYDAYLAAHNGNAPENVHNLRNWYKSHKASPVNNELFPLQPEPQAGAFSE
jgi:hypothetical protein